MPMIAMIDFASAMPAAIALLPKDDDGRPVPFAAVIIDGEQIYNRLDGQKILQCYRRRLCGVCGAPLGYWICFLGGSGNFVDRRFPHPPMHRECAEWLLAESPFWSADDSDRSRVSQKNADSVGILGAMTGNVYLTRGFEFHAQTRMFIAHARKEK